jgi:hypothetical protein
VKGEQRAEKNAQPAAGDLERLQAEQEAIKKRLSQIENASERFRAGNGPAGKYIARTHTLDLGLTIEEAEVLIRFIRNNIACDTWSEVGGKGTINYFPLGHALVVNQTADIHENIVFFLTGLRKGMEMCEKAKQSP